MNKLLLTAMFCLSCLFVSAQLTETLAKEQIKMVMKFQESNWNRGNIPAYMDGYWKSDSLLFIGSRGPTYGWNQTLANYQKAYANPKEMGKLKFNLIKIDVFSPEDAFVVGEWNLFREADTLGGYFSLLWKKIDEEWKIVTDHCSSN